MRRRAVLSTLLAAAVSAGALLWLLSDEAVVAALGSALAAARPWHLGAALALVPVVQGLRAWRFALLLDGRLGPPGWPMYRIAARLTLFNFLLPLKLGELSFPLMMRRAFGTEIARSAGILILSRLLDVPVLAAILLLGAAALPDAAAALGWSRPALLAAGAAALVAPALGLALLAPLRRGLPALPPRLAGLLDRLLWGATMLRALPQRMLALALGLAIWGTHAVIAWLAASAVAEGLGFIRVMLAGAAANVAFALPVPVVAGLGPPQAAWAAALNLAGVAWDAAVVTALTCHAVLVVGVVAVGAATIVAPGRPRPATLEGGGRSVVP